MNRKIKGYIGDCQKELESALKRMEMFLGNIKVDSFEKMQFSTLGLYKRVQVSPYQNDPQPGPLLINIRRLQAVCNNDGNEWNEENYLIARRLSEVVSKQAGEIYSCIETMYNAEDDKVGLASSDPLENITRLLTPSWPSGKAKAWTSFAYFLETARSVDLCFSDVTFDTLTKMMADRSNTRAIMVTAVGVMIALLSSPWVDSAIRSIWSCVADLWS